MTEIDKDNFFKVLDAISTHRFWKPLCTVLMNTDLLSSEILTLKWSQLDLSKNTYGIDNNTKQLPEVAVLALKAHKKYRAREQARCQNKYSLVEDDDLVFGNAQGQLRSYSGLCHIFKKFLKSKKLSDTDITLKTLRSFARQLQKEQSSRLNKAKMKNISM